MDKKTKANLKKLLKSERFRNFSVEARETHPDMEDDEDKMRFSAASNTPILALVETEDFFGVGFEVLAMNEDKSDLSRLREGGHFLLDHNSRGAENNLGIVTDAQVDGERLNVEVKRNPHNSTSEVIFNEMKDGFRSNVSIGFIRDEIGELIGEKDGKPVVEFGFTPLEVSSVLIPADSTVGVGRSIEDMVRRELNLDPEKEEHEKLVRSLVKEFKDQEGERPFADFEDFEDCVNQNQDKEDPEAYCASIEQEAKNEKSLENDDEVILIDERSAPESADKSTQIEEIDMSEKETKNDGSAISVGPDLEQERQRTATIFEEGRIADQPALAIKAVNEGWSIEKFKAELFEVAKTGRKVDIVDKPEENLDRQQQKELDIREAVQNYLTDGSSSPVDELGRQVAKERGVRTQKNALYIPIHAPIMPVSRYGHLYGKRAHGSTPAADGGALVGTEYFPIAPALFERSIGQQVGIQFHEVANQVQVPRFLTNMAVGFVGEESTISLGSGSFATDTASPHQAVAAVPLTAHLARALDGTYNPLDTIMSNAIQGVSEIADRSWISGSATAEPGGMLNLAGVPGGTEANLTGSNKLYAELWETVRNNKPAGRLGPFLVSVDTYKYGLENPALVGGNDRPTITTVPAANINGFTGMTSLGPVIETAHLPAQTALYGQWDQVLFFTFGVMEMVVDSSVRRLSGEDVVFVRLFCDNVVQEPRAFATGSGILLS